MLNKIIFAIDDDTDTHVVAKFMRHIDTMRALGELKGSFIPCIGCYDGMLESSYMMDERDYRRFVEPMGFTDQQDCILHVPADTRQPCTIEWNKFGDLECWNNTKTIGAMRSVTAAEAMQLRDWTYVIETNTYWSTS
jgi:hypothetical protein